MFGRVFACLAMLPFLYQPALAGNCDQWSAAMEETEGGSEMVARTCMTAGQAEFELFLQCGAPGYAMIRMIPVAPDSFPANEEYKSRFSLAVDDQSFDLNLIYEAMDGAMAGELEFASPAYKAMKTGKTVRLTDSAGTVPPSTYSLKGSKAALEAMEKSCRSDND